MGVQGCFQWHQSPTWEYLNRSEMTTVSRIWKMVYLNPAFGFTLLSRVIYHLVVFEISCGIWDSQVGREIWQSDYVRPKILKSDIWRTWKKPEGMSNSTGLLNYLLNFTAKSLHITHLVTLGHLTYSFLWRGIEYHPVHCFWHSVFDCMAGENYQTISCRKAIQINHSN